MGRLLVAAINWVDSGLTVVLTPAMRVACRLADKLGVSLDKLLDSLMAPIAGVMVLVVSYSLRSDSGITDGLIAAGLAFFGYVGLVVWSTVMAFVFACIDVILRSNDGSSDLATRDVDRWIAWGYLLTAGTCLGLSLLNLPINQGLLLIGVCFVLEACRKYMVYLSNKPSSRRKKAAKKESSRQILLQRLFDVVPQSGTA